MVQVMSSRLTRQLELHLEHMLQHSLNIKQPQSGVKLWMMRKPLVWGPASPWTLPTSSAHTPLFYPFCQYLGKLEGNLEQITYSALQDVRTRAHCPTSWSIYGLLYCMCAGLHQSYVILYGSVYITTMPSIFQDVYHNRAGLKDYIIAPFGGWQCLLRFSSIFPVCA